MTPHQHWVTKGTWVQGDSCPQPGESRKGGKTWVLGAKRWVVEAEIWVLTVGNGAWVCWVLDLGSRVLRARFWVLESGS